MSLDRPKGPKGTAQRLAMPHFRIPCGAKLHLHYARLTAGSIADLQSKFTSCRAI